MREGEGKPGLAVREASQHPHCCAGPWAESQTSLGSRNRPRGGQRKGRGPPGSTYGPPRLCQPSSSPVLGRLSSPQQPHTLLLPTAQAQP